MKKKKKYVLENNIRIHSNVVIVEGFLRQRFSSWALMHKKEPNSEAKKKFLTEQRKYAKTSLRKIRN